MAREHRISVRVRVLWIVGLLLTIGFAATNLVSFSVSRSALKSTILHNELPLTSSNIYSEIQADLLRPVFVSSLMANDTFLRDWVLGGEGDVTQVTRYLDEICKKFGVFTAFMVSDKSSVYYHFTGPTKTVSENDPRDAWFFRVRGAAQPYEINVDYNQEQSDEITIFVNYRLLDYQGHFLGATGVGLKMETVGKIISRYRDDYSRNIYFIDRNGHIPVRSAKPMITEARLQDAPGVNVLADQILSQKDGYYEYSRNGETMLLTTRFIPELGWTVMVEQREADAIRALWRALVVNLVIGLSIIAVTIAAVAMALAYYQRKLEAVSSTEQVAGLASRQAFEISMDYALRLHQRSARPLTLLLLDVDHFNWVCDSLGVIQGEDLLRKVAEAVRRVIRETDVVCRWSASELGILADDCSLEQGLHLAETLRVLLEAEPIFNPDDGFRVTLSVGVAEADQAETVGDLSGRAAQQLDQARKAGRNQVWPVLPDELGV